jgi:16S rRNA (guanine1207-N2)-methyltransferase
MSRLSLLRDSGQLVLPDGPVVVFGARMPEQLAGLDPATTVVVEGFWPACSALSQAGWTVSREPPEHAALSVVHIPRSRAAAQAAIARAAEISSGPVIVDGQKTDGVDGLLRAVRARVEIAATLSKAHGKLFMFSATDSFSDWRDPGPHRIGGGFVTRLGVFSADAPDPGSVLLAEALPPGLKGIWADLGAGWGYLASRLLERAGISEMHLVEADHGALDCARQNVTDPRARFHWADATAFDALPPLDGIVMNPPFHTDRSSDPALGQAFIQAAARRLSPRGQLWLVANRHLPYEATVRQCFAEVREIPGTTAYKLTHAARPTKAATRRPS